MFCSLLICHVSWPSSPGIELKYLIYKVWRFGKKVRFVEYYNKAGDEGLTRQNILAG
jgi:hypothetical protein